MNERPKIPNAPTIPPPPAPKPQPSAQSAAKEIEGIRRTLYNALNKLDQLQGSLKTT